jgi:glycopeptide antibiotics resistance protein
MYGDRLPLLLTGSFQVYKSTSPASVFTGLSFSLFICMLYFLATFVLRLFAHLENTRRKNRIAQFIIPLTLQLTRG